MDRHVNIVPFNLENVLLHEIGFGRDFSVRSLRKCSIYLHIFFKLFYLRRRIFNIFGKQYRRSRRHFQYSSQEILQMETQKTVTSPQNVINC